MKRSWMWIAAVVLLTAGIAVGLSAASLDAQQKSLLVAKKVGAAPATDGTLDEAWKGAPVLGIIGTALGFLLVGGGAAMLAADPDLKGAGLGVLGAGMLAWLVGSIAAIAKASK